MGEIPADQAFFQAGSACKDAGMLSYAFVFWNRFLDIADSMDEDSSGMFASGHLNAESVY